MPERFLFVELGRLDRAVSRCAGQELEIVLLLNRSEPVLAASFGPDHLGLFCTPAINLFPRRADRINLNGREAEYHVVPDRVRPLDFEVFGVTAVEGYAADGSAPQPFLPFYAANDLTRTPGHQAYYMLRREPRQLSARARQRGPRSSYLGHEVYISLVDPEQAPVNHSLRQLGLDLLCTNRDLPLSMPVGKQHTDLTIAVSAPVASVRCLVGPVAPRPCRSGGEYAWRFISHLGLNYLSLVDTDARQGASALREMLRLYVPSATSVAARQLEGLTSIASHPIVRRIPGGGTHRGGTWSGDHAHRRRGAVRRRGRHPARQRAGPVLREIRLDQRLHRDRAAQPRARRGDALAAPLRPAAGAVMSRRHAHPSRPRDGAAGAARGGAVGARLLSGDAAARGAVSRPAALRRQRAAGAGCGAAGAGTLGRVRPCHARRTGAGAGRPRAGPQGGAAAGAFLRPVRPGRRAAAASDGIRARPAAQPSRPDLSALRRHLPPSRSVAVLSRLGQREADRQPRSSGTGPLRALCRRADRARHGQPARPRRHAGPGQAAFRRASRGPDAACGGAWFHPLQLLPHAGADRGLHRRLARLAAGRPHPPGACAGDRDAGQDRPAGRTGVEPAAQVPHRHRAAAARRLSAASAGRHQLSPADPDRAQLRRRHADLGREHHPQARGGAAHASRRPEDRRGRARLDHLAHAATEAGRRGRPFLDASADSHARTIDAKAEQPWRRPSHDRDQSRRIVRQASSRGVSRDRGRDRVLQAARQPVCRAGALGASDPHHAGFRSAPRRAAFRTRPGAAGG